MVDHVSYVLTLLPNFKHLGIVVLGPKDEPIYHQPNVLPGSGCPQNHLGSTLNFEPVSSATKVKKIGPQANQNHEKQTLES